MVKSLNNDWCERESRFLGTLSVRLDCENTATAISVSLALTGADRPEKPVWGLS
jgi:hypothetical protein